MPDPVRVECADKADRDALVMILARNGYTVRQVREKAPNKTSYRYFVEFWR